MVKPKPSHVTTFPCKEGKFFLFNKGSPTVLDYCQFYRLLKKENLWPSIKHSNMITLYSSSHGLKYQMGQV